MGLLAAAGGLAALAASRAAQCVASLALCAAGQGTYLAVTYRPLPEPEHPQSGTWRRFAGAPCALEGPHGAI